MVLLAVLALILAAILVVTGMFIIGQGLLQRWQEQQIIRLPQPYQVTQSPATFLQTPPVSPNPSLLSVTTIFTMEVPLNELQRDTLFGNMFGQHGSALLSNETLLETPPPAYFPAARPDTPAPFHGV